MEDRAETVALLPQAVSCGKRGRGLIRDRGADGPGGTCSPLPNIFKVKELV